jgi:proline racemase
MYPQTLPVRKTPSGGNGRAAAAVGGLMLFYHFAVCRQLDSMASAEANVMVRVDDDVEKSTESAVQFLHELGWEVQEVRHAQMAESVDEFAGDAELIRLYQDASREGVACAVGGVGSTSRRSRDPLRAVG